MQKALIFLLILYPNFSFSQAGLLKNEKPILSFNLKNGKQVSLSKDSNNAYIVYRVYANNKLEWEFPEKNKSSWSKFKYSWYLRGGGTANAGLDLNYILFENKNFSYKIYDTYSAEANESDIGVQVTNNATKKTTDLKGIYKSRKGTLSDFRDNHLLQILEPEE